jgi:hypothetical protein
LILIYSLYRKKIGEFPENIDREVLKYTQLRSIEWLHVALLVGDTLMTKKRRANKNVCQATTRVPHDLLFFFSHQLPRFFFRRTLKHSLKTQRPIGRDYWFLGCRFPGSREKKIARLVSRMKRNPCTTCSLKQPKARMIGGMGDSHGYGKPTSSRTRWRNSDVYGKATFMVDIKVRSM